MRNYNAIGKYAESRNMTQNQVLEMLIEQGMTGKQMAAEIGCNPAAITNMCKRLEIRRGIIVDGIRDTVAGHCRRLGISERSVYRARHNLGLSKQDAIEYARP